MKERRMTRKKKRMRVRKRSQGLSTRAGGSIPSLLASDTASCVAVTERMIAVGTHSGTVHILDFLGNQDDTLLVIAWGTSIKIVSIRTNLHKAGNGINRPVPVSSMNQVDIGASFQTSYLISGVAPFGDALVVLAYIPREDGE